MAKRNGKNGISTPITAEFLLKPLFLFPTDRLFVSLKDNDTDEFELRVGSDPIDKFSSVDARRGFFERLPERKEGGYGGTRWTAPATDITAQLIHSLWPKEQVIFESPEAQVVYGYLIATVEHQRLAMERSAKYHEHVSAREAIKALGIPTPQFTPSFEMAHDHTPGLHQSVGWANSLHTDGFGGFMEQGTGKTPMTIGRICTEAPELHAKLGRLHRTIIACPKNVRSNWVREIEEFATVPGKATILTGGAIDRMKLLMEAMVPSDKNDKFTVVITSYEGLCNSWDTISKISWDLAVLDESHYIKWHETKRAKHAMLLRDVASARMCLTGTPVCNTTMDLYTQLEFLRKGGSGFKSFDAFRRFYGVFAIKDGTRGVKRLVDVQNLPFMRERLARMSFIVKQEEALPDLPPLTYDTVGVEMSEEQAKCYDAVSTQLFYEIKNELDDTSKAVNANNILVRMLRLAQITSGFVSFSALVDPETGEELQPSTIDRFDPNPKIEALIGIFKDEENDGALLKADDEKTIIWAHWIEDIKLISARLKLEGLDHVVFMGSTSDKERELAVERFNGDPACKIFVGTAGAGGTGLNLIGYPPRQADEYTTDVTQVIYFSQDWSSPKRSQSEKRAHRKGTRRPLRVTDLQCDNTIDVEIRERVTNKRLMAGTVQDLRDVLERVMRRKRD